MSNKNHKIIYSVMLLTLLTMFVPHKTIAVHTANENNSLAINQTQLETETQSEIQSETETFQDRADDWTTYRGRRDNALTTEWHKDEELYSEFLKRKFSGLEVAPDLDGDIVPVGSGFKHISPINVIEEKLPTITFPATFSTTDPLGPSANTPYNLTEEFTNFVSEYNTWLIDYENWLSNPGGTVAPITPKPIDTKIQEEFLNYIPFLGNNEIFITDTYDDTNITSDTENKERHKFQVKTTDGFFGIESIKFWETDIWGVDDYGKPELKDPVEHGEWDKASLDSIVSANGDDTNTGNFVSQGSWGWDMIEEDSNYNITIDYNNTSSTSNTDDGLYVFEYGSSAKDQSGTDNSDYIWNSDESYIEASVDNFSYDDGIKEWKFTVDLQTYNFPYSETFIDDESFIDYPYWFNSTTTENSTKFNDANGNSWDDDFDLMAPWIDIYIVKYDNDNIGNGVDEGIEELRLIDTYMMTNADINNADITQGTENPKYQKEIRISESDIVDTGASFVGNDTTHGDVFIFDVNWHARHSHQLATKTAFNYQNNPKQVTKRIPSHTPYYFSFYTNSDNIKIEYLGYDKFNFTFEVTIYEIDQARNREIIYKTGNDEQVNNAWASTGTGVNNHMISNTANKGDVEEFSIDLQISQPVTFIQFGVSSKEGANDGIDPLLSQDTSRESSEPKAYFRNSIMVNDITTEFVEADWKITFHIWAPDNMKGKQLWWKEDAITKSKFVDDQTYYGPGSEIENTNCIFEGGTQSMIITIKSSVWEILNPDTIFEFTLGASEIGAYKVESSTIIATNIDNVNDTMLAFPTRPTSDNDEAITASIIIGLTLIILFGIIMLLMRLKNSKTNRLLIASLGSQKFDATNIDEDFELSL